MSLLPKFETPWESGSEFHWGCLSGGKSGQHPWSQHEHRLGASGRDVMRLVVEHGLRVRNWQRAWIPSYFCQEVVESLMATGIASERYPDYPSAGSVSNIDELDYRAGDVVFVVNQFGIRQRPNYQALEAQNVDTIEDHTHDPWSRWAKSSLATYCVASLRKTLPVPDGGVLWSSSDLSLPHQPPIIEERELASSRRLAAMVLKERYLRGDSSCKKAFRELYQLGESHIADGRISGATQTSVELIKSFDVELWRRKRDANIRELTEGLANVDGIDLADLDSIPSGQSAFSLLLLAESQALREHLRTSLVSGSVYPAILWPMTAPGLSPSAQDIDLSCKLLSVHADGRYASEDLQRIANIIRRSCEQFRSYS
ncbi:MAG: hypothetical protein GY811_17985 [Myxococcales bacterium]|nr:hypothetical protein [Myxococcales bacterium]